MFGGRKMYLAYAGTANEQVFCEYLDSAYGDVLFKAKGRCVRDVRPMLHSKIWKPLEFHQLPDWYRMKFC